MKRIVWEWAALGMLGLVCGCSDRESGLGGGDLDSAKPAQLGRVRSGLSQQACALLDDEARRPLLSGAFENFLMHGCGRVAAPQAGARPRGAFGAGNGPLTSPPRGEAGRRSLSGNDLSGNDLRSNDLGGNDLGGNDILVNDPALDRGGSTQSETSIVVHNNVVCASWNDSGENFFEDGASGFGFSTDGGQSFEDGGPMPRSPEITSGGDPSLAYSERDATFYYAALSTRGLALWGSTNDCQSFQLIGLIHAGVLDDKELMAVDNSPSSPNFGRLYVGWTDFARSDDLNVVSFSDDGGLSWSEPSVLPRSGTAGQGMWPAIAPNGDVYFALLNRGFTVGSTQDQWIYQGVPTQALPDPDAGLSQTGQLDWVQRTNIGTSQLLPEDPEASISCGRQALGGSIRNLSSPQIAITPDEAAPAGYVIHATYPYDSDGPGPDHSNVFYRRSEDGAQTWSGERQLNDDETDTDQFFPSLAAQADGLVVVSWYDRRLDPENNLAFDRFLTHSTDGGFSWQPNERVSDVSSPVAQTNPNFDNLGTCYHGDYDQIAVADGVAHVIWSDDRRIVGTGPNPDVYYDRVELTPSRGFLTARPDPVSCEGEITLRLRDSDLEGAGEQTVSVISETGDEETVVLAETSTPGVFSRVIPTTDEIATSEDGRVSVAHGSTLRILYEDADNGDGSQELVSTAVGTDCEPPVVQAVAVSNLSTRRATLSIQASEAVDTTVTAGLRCEERNRIASGRSSVTLENLREGARYFFAVAVTDSAGNATEDDNDGECYTFNTLSELFAEDFESGTGGFLFDNDESLGLGGLWHRTEGCASLDFGHSRPGALYFGFEDSCTYQSLDGATAHRGFATSPAIEVENADSAVVEFRYFLSSEGGGGFDQASTAISVNGGEFEFVETNFSTIVPPPPPIRFRTRDGAQAAPGEALLDGRGQWEQASIALAPHVAGPSTADVRIRFGFDTIDSIANDLAGFYVDDLRIVGLAEPVACERSADCDDGSFCNGTELCNAGVCQPGEPVQCAQSDDGVACTVSECSEEVEACVTLTVDELCTDGLFCNGLEVCDATLGCQPGETPECGGGSECTTASCSELLKSCSVEVLNALCNDGLFCNGQEVCDVRLGCLPGAPPCQDDILCTDDTCDEFAGCAAVTVDAVCDDGIFCNGTERCDAQSGCVVGPLPCLGSSCEEAQEACATACIETSNAEHVAAGRAERVFDSVFLALGSNDFMGPDATELVALEGGAGFWERVDTCGEAPAIVSLGVQVIGQTVVVEGTATDVNDDIAAVQLQLEIGGGGGFTAIANGTTQFSLIVAQLPVGAARVTAVAFDIEGRSSIPAQLVFEIAAPQPPSIDSIQVSTADSGGVSIFGTASDPNSDIDSVTVAVRRSGELQFVLEAAEQSPWAVELPGLAPGQYTAQARVVDSSGRVGLSEVIAFEVAATSVALCHTATSREHQQAGRARALFGDLFFFANGSDDFLGVSGGLTTSLQLEGTRWVLVESCP